MKKQIIGIGDIHLRSKGFYRLGISRFFNWIDKTLPSSEKEFTEILLAGDVLNKVTMLPEAAGLAVKLLKLLKTKASKVYIILGNHDYGLSNYKVISAKKFLCEEDNVVVIDTLCEYTTDLGFKLLCLPWCYGMKHSDVDAYVAQLPQDASYDVCTAHWELESCMGSDFINLKTNAKAFMCGHIHSHKVNPYYLGSVLPNSIAEQKDDDPSILRYFIRGDNGYSVKDVEIPSFVHIETVTIGNLGDIAQYTGHPDIFYKIIHPKTIAGRDIKSQARISGVLVYETEKLETETTKKEIKDVDDVPEYRVQTHKDILNSCKEKLQLDQDTYDLCMRTIEIVDQAS